MLSEAPQQLSELATTASTELEALCLAHGLNAKAFSASDGTVLATSSIFDGSSAALPSAPHLYPVLPSCGSLSALVEQRKVFSKEVLHTFEDKVHGRAMVKTTTSSGVDSAAAAALDVPEHVEALIQEATSVDKLARMYEGWMPWV